MMTFKHLSLTSLSRTALTFFLAVGFALFMAAFLITVTLSTDEGQKWTEKTLTYLLSSDQQRITITGLRFDLRGELHVDQVSFSDQTSPWLRLQDIDLDWNWTDLLFRHAHLNACRIRKLVVLHEAPKNIQSTAPERLKKNPFYISLHRLQTSDHFEIKTLALRKAFSGLTKDFSFNVVGKLRQRKKLVGALKIQDLLTPENHFDASLVLDRLNQKLSVELDAHEAPLGLISQLLSLENKVPITLNISGNGPLKKWKSTYDLNLGEKGGFNGKFDLRLKRGFWHYATKGHLNVNADTFPDLATLLGEPTVIRSSGQLSHKLLNVESLSIKNNRVNLTGYLNADFDTQKIQGETSTHVPNLEIFKPLLNRDLAGEGTILTNLKGAFNALEHHTDVSLSHLTFGTHTIDQTLLTFESVYQSMDRDVALLFDLKTEGIDGLTLADGGLFSQPLTLKGSGAYLPSSKTLTFYDITGSALGAELAGEGVFDKKNHTLNLSLDLPNLDVVLGRKKLTPQSPPLGAAHYDLVLNGPASQPSLSIKGQLNDIQTEHKTIGSFLNELTLTNLYTSPQGTFRLYEAEGDVPLSLSADILNKDTNLQVNNIALQVGTDPLAQGNLILDKNTSLIEGDITSNNANLELLEPYVPLETLSGLSTLSLTFKKGPRKNQVMTSTLNLYNLVSPALTAKESELNISVENFDQIDAKLLMNTSVLGAKEIEKVEATLQGTLADLSLNTIFEDPSLNLHVNGHVRQESDGITEIIIDPSEGTLHNQPLKIEKIDFRLGGKEISIQPTRISYNKGHASFHLFKSKDDLDGAAKLDSFPMAFFNLISTKLTLGGDGEGELSLKGPGRVTEGKLNLLIKGLKSHDPIHGDVPALNASFKSELKNGKLSGRFGTITKSGATLQGKLDQKAADLCKIEVPSTSEKDSRFVASFYFETEDSGDQFFPIIDKYSAFNVNVLGNLNLASFSAFFPEEEDVIQGTLKSKLTLTGTTAKPHLNGTLSLIDGYYENDESGIAFKNLKIQGESKGDTLHIRSIQSEDNLTGKVSGSGKVTFKSLFEPHYQLNAKFTDMRVLNQEDLKVTATGQINLIGNESTAKIQGNAEVSKGLFDLAETSSADIVKMDVTELKSSQTRLTRLKKPVRIAHGPGYLDIDVHATDTLLVRGWGLKAKLGGKLKVMGTFARTELLGVLETKEGTFDLLGPKFKISKGIVTFEQGGGLMPKIDFMGTHPIKAKSLLIKAYATGPADKFKMKFQSEPELDQNEILSQLVLGKSFSQAESFEALKIALLASRVSSKGRENILSFFQNPLGLDVDFEQAKDKGSGYKKIKIGKRIYDRVRVEVEEDFETRTTGGMVAVDITPHLSVETGYGSDQQGTVGIKWNKDY